MSTIATITVPLSSVFTPPASCSKSWTYEPESYNQVTSGILLQNAIQNYADTECFPPGFSQAGRLFRGQVFSPGACPQGYITHSLIQVSNSITIATCCSSNFSYYSSSYQGCLSMWSGDTSLIVRAGGFTVADTIANTSISGTFTMWAQPVTVELQANDITLYTTTTSASMSISSLSMSMSATSLSLSASATSVVMSSSTAISEPQSSDLSTGAIAGITIGATAGMLVLIVVGLFCIKKYRRSHKVGLEEVSGVYYQPGSVSFHNHTLGELESNEAKKPIAELNAIRPRLELES